MERKRRRERRGVPAKAEMMAVHETTLGDGIRRKTRRASERVEGVLE